jgi:hypothetical protein
MTTFMSTTRSLLISKVFLVLPSYSQALILHNDKVSALKEECAMVTLIME